MRRLLGLLLVAICTASKIPSEGRAVSTDLNDLATCDEYKSVAGEYRSALTYFSIKMFKKIAERGNFHFVFSPFSVWRILAALAEGADSASQAQLFQILGLPDDLCSRQRYYHISNQSIKPGDDVEISSSSTLVIDTGLTVNSDWLELISKNSLINIVSTTIKEHPMIAANHMRQLMSAPLPNLNLKGNSVILDSITFKGLWTTAFSDAVAERAPFYNHLGNKIGSVDLMTMKKRVRMAYMPRYRAKILELPVGANSRYRMLFGMILSNDQSSMVNSLSRLVMDDVFGILQDSHIPIDVAIPQFTIMSDIDVRSVLEDAGVSNLWTNPAATKFVSEPPALPSSFPQRATLTLSKEGLHVPAVGMDPPQNASTGLDPKLGRDFIANRPFLFALVDAETYTCLMTASYSKPMYPQ